MCYLCLVARIWLFGIAPAGVMCAVLHARSVHRYAGLWECTRREARQALRDTTVQASGFSPATVFMVLAVAWPVGAWYLRALAR